MSFASSPTKIESELAVTASAKITCGRVSCIFFSATNRFCFSFLSSVANWIRKSGFCIAFWRASSVIYAPCLRIVGRTSLVTHLRNCLASGLRLSRMTSYKPSSFTNSACCVPPAVSRGWLETTSLLSRWLTNFAVNPNALHTSARQNCGLASVPATRMLPKAGLLNTWIDCIR